DAARQKAGRRVSEPAARIPDGCAAARKRRRERIPAEIEVVIFNGDVLCQIRTGVLPGRHDDPVRTPEEAAARNGDVFKPLIELDGPPGPTAEVIERALIEAHLTALCEQRGVVESVERTAMNGDRFRQHPGDRERLLAPEAPVERQVVNLEVTGQNGGAE